MRFSRVWFAVRWLIVAVVFVLVFVGIWDGAMKGRSIHYQEMARQSAEEAAEAEAAAKWRESMSYQDRAKWHADWVERLDDWLHPRGTSFTLFTDDYYRNSEKYERWWPRLRDWHAQMAEKYRRAALRPWEPVPPDPPEPR
jgi:hypothetical protein